MVDARENDENNPRTQIQRLIEQRGDSESALGLLLAQYSLLLTEGQAGQGSLDHLYQSIILKLLTENIVLSQTAYDHRLVVVEKAGEIEGLRQEQITKFATALADKNGASEAEKMALINKLYSYFLDKHDDGSKYGTPAIKLGDEQLLIFITRHEVADIGMITTFQVIDVSGRHQDVKLDALGALITKVRDPLTTLNAHTYVLEKKIGSSLNGASDNMQAIKDALAQLNQILDDNAEAVQEIQKWGLLDQVLRGLPPVIIDSLQITPAAV